MGHRLHQEEVFGPVLHVVRWGGDIDALVARINALGYGLTLGIQTRIDSRALRIADRAAVALAAHLRPVLLHGLDHVRFAHAGTVHGTPEAGRHVVHHAAGRDAGHDGAGLAFQPAPDDEHHGRVGAERRAVLLGLALGDGVLEELVDGCYIIIELHATESPAQETWKRDWLAKAKRLVPSAPEW